MVSRIVNGKRYGPYPQVQHYAGYDIRAHKRKIKVCYIRTQLLKQNQRRQLKRLLSKSHAASPQRVGVSRESNSQLRY
jgi:hypothetical protein